MLKLSFDGRIPKLDKYADLNCGPHYVLIPGGRQRGLVLGSDLSLTGKRKSLANQWKLECKGRGIYKIANRESGRLSSGATRPVSPRFCRHGRERTRQLWKIENGNSGLLVLTNRRFPDAVLSVAADPAEGVRAGVSGPEKGSIAGWTLAEVCETPQTAFKPHRIPGTVEAEDFDAGCPENAYSDRNEVNEGGQYRLNQGVDIERCSAGGYNVGWTHAGEWMAYSVAIDRSAEYKVSFSVASGNEGGQMHLECDGRDVTGIVPVPFTGAFQNWTKIGKTVKLDAGPHELKLVIDADNVNLDKMIFEEIR